MVGVAESNNCQFLRHLEDTPHRRKENTVRESIRRADGSSHSLLPPVREDLSNALGYVFDGQV
ncbi:hypothetical protein GCM10009796_80100 [Microbacterium koreense]